jgi:signal transduction histidine kinase
LGPNEISPEFRMVKILAVDDREENLLALEAALEGPDCQIVSTLSGPDALAELEKDEFAMILLDVQMPGMDGFETARRIRQIPRAKFTPIIFVTAIYRAEAYVEQGYVEGAVDYLFKPLNIDVLRAKVAVFADLFRKTKELQAQAERLRQSSLREQENEFLKASVKARDEFISIVSHELKTPLTPLALNIQSFLQLLLENRLETFPRDKLERMLRTSNNQIDRLSKLVSELLDASRISEGKLKIEREEMDLSESIRSIAEHYSEPIRRTGCGLEVFVQDGIRGNWDRFRIEQVLTNLLTNAMKYCAGNPVEIHAEANRDEARIHVKDHGIGIAAEDQARIFKRFERAVSSKHFGGLGLGLYISKQIVESHGGKILVESEFGKGTTFTVVLPRSLPAEL